MSILETLKSRFEVALAPMADDIQPLLAMIRPSQDPKFGDFQANCAMPMARKAGKAPRDVAAELIAAVDVSDLCEEPEVAGPGFINLRLKDEWIADRINAIRGDDRLGILPVESPKHVVVDFSSPNVAKPMHVGHLRSSVIGDAICRTLRFAGHKVTSDNHIGDWGTQFGMIIYGYRNFVDEAAYRQDPVAELARLYRLVNDIEGYQEAKNALPELRSQLLEQQSVLNQQESELDPADKKTKKKLKSLRKGVATTQDKIKALESRISDMEQDGARQAVADQHPNIGKLARQETSKLHSGDAGNQQLWDEFLPACLDALHHVYDCLGISFDLELGESHYNSMLADVVASLDEADLSRVENGAKCVFIDGYEAPFMIQKSDQAYTYATTDLATVQYRINELKADEILYVVDKRQAEHFDLLFQTCRLWQYPDLNGKHVSFGTVMGKDGRPFKTRSGDNVGLESLIDEAISRARRIVDENDDRREQPLLSNEDRDRVAEIVGVGGIKYADLHHNRDSDYTFDWDKMLATSGDTATYMQYAYARICGIFRELEIDRDSLSTEDCGIQLTMPEERALALQLIQFDLAIGSVLFDYRPNQLTAWLFEASGYFSAFYAKCSVKNAESEVVRNSRLMLCDLMARALKTGLSLLGIQTAEVL